MKKIVKSVIAVLVAAVAVSALSVCGTELPFKAFPGAHGSAEMTLVLKDKTVPSQFVFNVYSSKGDGLNIQYRKNRLIASFYDRSAKKWYQTAKSRPLALNKASKVRLTWALPGEVTLTVNGKPAGNVAVDVAPSFAKNSKIFIGSNQVGSNKFTGEIKNFKFGNGAAVGAVKTETSAAKKSVPSVVAEYVFELTIDEPLKDLSSNGFHPLNTPDESKYVKGELDAVRFAAKGDGIQLPSGAFPGAAGALEMVVCPEKKISGKDTRNLLSVYSPKNDVFNLSYRNNRLQVAYYDRSAKKWHYTTPGISLAQGKFARVTVTWQLPGEIVLTVDGKRVAKVAVGNAASFAKNSKVFIGSNPQKEALFPGLVHSVKFFNTPQVPDGKKKVKTAGEIVTHRLGGMTLGFDKKSLQLKSWICGNVEYFSKLHDTPAWSIRVRDAKTGKYFDFDSDDVGRTSFKVSEQQIEFVWSNIALPDGSKFDVAGTVAVAGKNKLNWQLRTGVLPEQYAIDMVSYPRLPCAPTAKNPREMYVCYPKYYGINIPDAFNFKTGRGRRFGSSYPGGAHYQFGYLYGKDVPGVFLHAADSAGNYKELIFNSMPEHKTMIMQLKQTPVQRAVSRQFVSQYPVYSEIIPGDWYDAAKVYRRWAVKQSWSRKGTLDKRTDLPKWVFDTHIATRPSTQTTDMAVVEVGKKRVAINRSNHRIIRDELRCGGLTVWYSYCYVDPGHNSKWHGAGKYNGRPEFKLIPGVDAAVAEMKTLGFHTIGYLNTRIYDETDDPGHADTQAVRPLVMRYPDGSLQRYSGKPFDVCRIARNWQERLLNIIKHDAVANGFSGMYLDSFGRGQTHCWATNHGHLPGCTTSSVSGQRAMAELIKGEMQKVIPGFVIASEASIEQFVDLIDFKLHHENIYEHAVPVWTKIYHDRQFVYGRNTDPARTQTTACFHIGALLGRIFTGNSDENLRERYLSSEVVKYYRQLIAMRKHFYAQIGVGEMLRPPQVVSDAPALNELIGKKKLAFPAVTASAWRSSAGVPCAFFTNASAQTAKFTFTLDKNELPGTPKHWVLADDEGNLRTVPFDGTNSFELPPLSVAALEYEAVK
ncbi:MAG: LamG domain-containing protein [Lentisphaerae bacterium]|nr:LamG domain-containing protein [Lentisphaerota bacterium]